MADAPDLYDAVFASLAHPARRRILISLAFGKGELSAGAIAGLFGHAWPTTTRHLRQLEEAGLVVQERRGRGRFYRLRREPLRTAAQWLDWFGRDPVTAERIDPDDHAAHVPPQRRSERSGSGG